MLCLPWDLHAIGGVSQVVAGLYDGIRTDGRLTPRILVAAWDQVDPVEHVDEAHRSIIRARIRSPLARTSLLVGLLRYAAMLPVELYRLRALVRRYSIQVVNCHYIGSTEFTWIVAKSLGLFRGKVLLSMHGLDIRTLASSRGLLRVLWGWELRHADAVVACSDGLAVEVRNEFQLAKEDVVTIHNGVDVATLAGARAGPPATRASRGPTLLNLGTFEHKKGHDVLLRAFRKVLDRRPNAHLTIMGRDGECTQSTLRLVTELGLEQATTIRIDTPHDVALEALRATDIFVLSSRNEAFSIALLEAAAFGKPVVATDVCGVAELIQDDTLGMRVPAEDPDALCAGILRLIEDRDMALACGRRLRDLVSAKFTLEQNCRDYLRLAGYQPREFATVARTGAPKTLEAS